VEYIQVCACPRRNAAHGHASGHLIAPRCEQVATQRLTEKTRDQASELSRFYAMPRPPSPRPTTSAATQTSAPRYAAVQTSPMLSPEQSGVLDAWSAPVKASHSLSFCDDHVATGTPMSGRHATLEASFSTVQTPSSHSAAQRSRSRASHYSTSSGGHRSEDLARNQREIAALSAHIRSSLAQGSTSALAPSAASDFLPSPPSLPPAAAPYWPGQSAASDLDHLAIRFVLRLNVGLGVVKEDRGFGEAVRSEVRPS
jgi:hypothetical protein